MNSRLGIQLNNEQNLKVIGEYMLRHKETVAIAESVTSGHVQALFSTAEGATHFYQGGTTAYNLNQKVELLHVDPMHAIQSNCVSEIVAAEMALGVARRFSSDWGISITGYATQIPEEGITTLFAFYSFAYKGKTITTNLLVCGNLKNAAEVQRYYAASLVNNFKRYLQSVSMDHLELAS